jgi:acyl carrier protein
MSSLNELQDLIHEKYGIAQAELDPHASMRDKGVDSLALVEFLFAVEDHFHIDMPDADSKVDTLADLAVVVDRILAAKTPA